MATHKPKEMGMVLTNRERELLAVLYHLRIVSTSQLLKLFYSGFNKRYARQRIADLAKHDYLRMDNFSTRGNRLENRYSLTRKGINVAIPEAIESQYSLEGKRLSYTVKQNYVDPTQQKHQLLINELFVQLVQEKCFNREDADFSILNLLKKDWFETRRAIIQTKGVSVKPDASFQIGNTIFWVEVDRGTESLAHIRSKFRAYEGLLFQGVQKEYKHILLFLCEKGLEIGEQTFRKRVVDIRKIAMEKLEGYLDERFEVYVDEYETLSQFIVKELVQIVKTETPQHLYHFGFELKEWAEGQGYVGLISRALENNPVQSKFQPAAWFQYQDKLSQKQAKWFIIESLHGTPLSAWRRLREFYSYCHSFEYETKIPLRVLVIADNERDLAELNHLYPDLKSVTGFTTLDIWSQKKRFYQWERGKLKSEGVLS